MEISAFNIFPEKAFSVIIYVFALNDPPLKIVAFFVQKFNHFFKSWMMLQTKFFVFPIIAGKAVISQNCSIERYSVFLFECSWNFMESFFWNSVVSWAMQQRIFWFPPCDCVAFIRVYIFFVEHDMCNVGACRSVGKKPYLFSSIRDLGCKRFLLCWYKTSQDGNHLLPLCSVYHFILNFRPAFHFSYVGDAFLR